ncbi:MAG TPA: hypothetical protein VGI81_04060 [Tepidisphaeraceae bacterium]|jgi:hypothetical protein
MPLHDWAELSGWEGMHLLWMSELPSLPLALNTDGTIEIDLESTYMRAAADAYLA